MIYMDNNKIPIINSISGIIKIAKINNSTKPRPNIYLFLKNGGNPPTSHEGSDFIG